MIVIVGMIIVVGAVLGGFTMAGGHVGALLHPSEAVTIGGASLGALIIMSPKEVLVGLMKGTIGAIKGSPYTKKSYEELFKVLYELLREARRNGMLALESHLADPHHSSIFSQAPTLMKQHHALDFLCGALVPLVEGVIKPEQLGATLETDLRVFEEEHHGPLTVLQKTADALPGFGIVAAVLGIVITMGAIDGPVEEVGHKVGAALVGTFLGILLSYGFFAPLAARMESIGVAEAAFMRTISTTVLAAFADNLPPKVAVELARRSVASHVRMSREELDKLFSSGEG